MPTAAASLRGAIVTSRTPSSPIGAGRCWSGNGVVRDSKYKVVWRHGHEVGAEFVGVVRSGFAL